MRQLFGFLAGALFSLAAFAAQDVTVSGAWVRATAPGQDSASMQFAITSKSEAKLVAVSSPVAGSVEMHSMKHENGMMKMQAIDSIALPAGKTVDLEKSGRHIMLLNLKQPLKEGDSVPFALTVQFPGQTRKTVEAKAEVRPLTASHDMRGMPGM
jgi:copper(I)-binding protein